jgi:hypothetical protein
MRDGPEEMTSLSWRLPRLNFKKSFFRLFGLGASASSVSIATVDRNCRRMLITPVVGICQEAMATEYGK